MPAIVGALRAELSSSIAQFQDDMGKAADAVRKFAEGAEKQAKKLEAAGKQLSLSLTAPLVAFGYESVKAGTSAAKAMGQVEAALKSTGAASGKSAAELKESAEQLQAISLFGASDILAKVTASLLSFSNVQGPVFDRAQKDVVDLAARFNIDLQAAAIAVGRALQNPAKGLDGLRRSGVLFTQAQKDAVVQLQATGQGAKAQGIILEQLERQVAGAANAARRNDPFAALKQSLDSLYETAGPIITDVLTPLINGMTELFKAVKELPEPLQKVAVYIGVVLAAIGPAVFILGTFLKNISILTPAIVKIGAAIYSLGAQIAAAIGISLGALVGWAVALAAAVGAVVVFWKSIKDVIHGNFQQAWQDAKASASKLVDDVNAIFKKKPAELPVTLQGSAAGDKPNGGFDMPQQIAQATKQFQDQIRQQASKIANAFGRQELPKAVSTANELNSQIDEYITQAKEAGVNTGAFSKQIDTLRGRIEALKQAGLTKEAQQFGITVDDATKAVGNFARGGMDPLSAKLKDVDDQYNSLKDRIQQQIDANSVLANTNDDAAKAMARLKQDLIDLEAAHVKATKAAEDQDAAEKQLAHLQSVANQADTGNQIQDLKDLRNGTGPIGSNQRNVQQADRDIQQSLINAESQYLRLAAVRRAGEEKLTDQEKSDLDKEIAGWKDLADILAETSGQQLTDARRISDAWSEFTDTLGAQLSNMLANLSFDLKGLRNVFAQLAQKLFINPALQAGSDALGGILKGAVKDLFSGGHAAGGFIPPGHWGIVGEKGPEPAFGGKTGMTVQPNGRGGVTIVQNIQTPDYGAFRQSRRQLARQTKMALQF